MLRRTAKQLCCETLENRNLLAGNVTAFLSGENLIINGDAAANTISVESAGAGNVQVRGFENTSINRAPNGLRVFGGVTGDIFIRLREGDDLVRVTNLVAPGSVLVDLGAGADEAITGRNTTAGDAPFGGTPSGPLYVQGALRVIGGSENDVSFQSDVHVQGIGVVNLGAGTDSVRFQRPDASAANVEYNGFLSILPGDGDDVVSLTGLVVDDNVTIDDGTGRLDVSINSADVFGNLNILADAQADTINVSAVNVRGQLFVATFGGNDVVNLSAIADRLAVDTGADNDELHVTSSNTIELSLQLGIGDDDLDLLSAATDRLFAYGNEGDDVFLVRNTRAIDAFFYGDSDFDIYRESSLLPNNIQNLNRFTIERNERV